jgi:hypothetical protein
MMSSAPVLCFYCANPMSLLRVSNDMRAPDQQVLRCTSCRLIEIRAPDDKPGARRTCS